MNKDEQTKQEDKPIAVGMGAFDVKKQAEDGIEVKLTLPDGTETAEWLKVRGSDSRQFKKAKARLNRERINRLKAAKGKKVDAGDEAMKEEEDVTKLVSSLVIDWSFKQECTTENVVAFLKTAPQIQEQIDAVAGQRHNFFTNPSTD